MERQKMPNALDRTDKALLSALQGNARLTVAELADSVALTTSPCWRRVKILEESGVITGYQAILSPKALGYGVTAFVSVMMESHCQDTARAFEQRLLEIPEIVACHNVSGRYDFLLEVLAKDLESFGEFAREVLQTLPAVKEIYSSFSFKSVKPSRVIPVLG
jgi:Lrp/AsnC family leucine-responsive transcriptional regulator